jgi:hypothetical protein
LTRERGVPAPGPQTLRGGVLQSQRQAKGVEGLRQGLGASL